MKKYLWLFLLLFTLGTLKANALNGRAGIEVDEKEFYADGQIKWYFYIEEVEDLYGFQVEISYEEGYLHPLENTVSLGKPLQGDHVFIAVNQAEQGKIKLMGTLIGQTAKIESSGKLFSLSMAIRQSGVTKIRLDRLKFVDKNGGRIEVDYSDRMIEIEEKQGGTNGKGKTRKPMDEEKAYIHGDGEGVDSLKITVFPIHKVSQQGILLRSKVYEITASKSRFSQPITLTLPYVYHGTNLNKLGIYYFHENTGRWLYIGGNADEKNQKMTVKVHHLAKYAVFEDLNPEMPKDVRGHWSYPYVKRLWRRQIIEGYEDGTFQPDRLITREEVAVMFAKALNFPSHGESSFGDYADIQEWSQSAVAVMTAEGLWKGYEDGCFYPRRHITRAEFMTLVGRMLPEKEGALSFHDQKAIPPWALEGIKRCSAYGMIQGDENHHLQPNAHITRGETAAILYRLLKVLGI